MTRKKAKGDKVDKQTKKLNKKWDNLRKQAKKRRRKIDEGRITKHKSEVLKSIFTDKDKRTRRSGFHTLIYILLLVGVFFSFVMGINGGKNWYKDTIMNTSALGTELEFPLSGAEIKLGDVYTDKNRNLTVVRLSYDEEAHTKLPANGSDYDLMLKSKDHKNIKAAYGLLGSNGDGYIFIKGKMGNQPFQVGLRNKVKLSTGKDEDSSGGNTTKIQEVKNENEMIDSITGTSETSANKNGIYNIFKDDSKKEIKYDAINFRINSHSKTTKVYKGSFINKDGSIKYGEVVKQMNTKQSLDKINENIKKYKSKVETYKISIKEYEGRVKKDKHNSQAKKNLEDVKKAKKDAEKSLEINKKAKEQYENYSFDKSSFEKMSDENKTIYKKMK
ncbi:hypothetical protein LDL00_11550 [Staphylococcus epidermidis]|uniref:hypothetical protein n=1 Tax=Staphylococcus epidermidis TaxID=1282 RepID=UPI001E4C57DC|nr:hypothetical protein [Staphylococcus epidermidis]MCD9074459.1 hypothetical protein [Staphylococcus epidermidis]